MNMELKDTLILVFKKIKIDLAFSHNTPIQQLFEDLLYAGTSKPLTTK